MSERVVVFKKCRGVNDSLSPHKEGLDPRTGETDLYSCTNMTTTPDGLIVNAPALTTVVTHTGAVTNVSAGTRLFFQDGVDGYELVNLTTPTKRFNAKVGVLAHTPIDVRVCTGAAVYKSLNSAPAEALASVGTNPGPATSKTYSAMPNYERAFMFNSNLCLTSGKFFQYSDDFSYDLWNLGDSFIGHKETIYNAGAVPGCCLLLHQRSITRYVGQQTQIAAHKPAVVAPIVNSLFSGFLNAKFGYGHAFLAEDGLYIVTADGQLTLVTGERLTKAASHNTSYYCAMVDRGKYIAFGNTVAVEVDLDNGAVMRRAAGVSSATNLGEVGYVASGSTIATYGTSAPASCAVRFPFATLGGEGRKTFDSLYFSGYTAPGVALSVAVYSEPGAAADWTHTTTGFGDATLKRIKLPRRRVGTRVSIELTCAGAFRLDELYAAVSVGQRTQRG